MDSSNEQHRLPLWRFAVIGLAQIIGHGSLYYSLTVLADPIANDFGWPTSSVYGCLSATLLAGGFMSPLAGQFMDRHGAPKMMVIGALCATISLAMLSQTTGVVGLVCAFLLLQVASSLTLYEAVFTAFVQIDALQGRKYITRITLFGGLSSTVFWPLTEQLQIWLGWRGTCLAFATLQLLVVLPIYALSWGARDRRERRRVVEAATGPVLKGKEVWPALLLVTIGFALSSFGYNAINLTLVTAIKSFGMDAATITFLGALMGPATIAGRFGEAIFGARFHPLVTARLTVALLVCSVLIVILAPHHVLPLGVFMLIFGLSNGLTSIVRGTLPLALFGPDGYGKRVGAINTVRVIVVSGAPLLFSLALEGLGPLTGFVIVGGLGLLSLVCFASIRRPHREISSNELTAADAEA